MTECLFCRIVRKEVPCRMVFEDEGVLAFHDILPHAPVHVLVVPKKHVVRLSDLESTKGDLLARVQDTVRRLADHFSVNESGFRWVANNGPDAGQAVGHLHFHFLAGRRFSWPPG
ncbi:MAG: histidine triad nucleotide-binding protein [Elusimicrobia bacterium]|nr:histidine triad nucleotide-binding protein [Elusimicrobiota bacterium]